MEFGWSNGHPLQSAVAKRKSGGNARVGRTILALVCVLHSTPHALPGDGQRLNIEPQRVALTHPVIVGRRSGVLADAVVEYIRDQIAVDVMRPGERLPTELQLMGALKVSRSVIREAYSQLQAAGLIETRHGVGSFVADRHLLHTGFQLMQPQVVADMFAAYELRMAFETEGSSLAARRALPTDLARIEGAHGLFERRLGDGLDSVAADFQFHLAIEKATHNPHFADIFTSVARMQNSFMERQVSAMRAATCESPERLISEHAGILEAITCKDTEGARAAMRTHLANSRERLRQAVAPM